MVAGQTSVPINCDTDIVTARQLARELAKESGFSSSEVAGIAAAISELARNIVIYAEKGEVHISMSHEKNRNGIIIVAEDLGPGITDISLALLDGYSTSNSLGLGLPGVKRLMDTFEIESRPGNGTKITVTKWTFI